MITDKESDNYYHYFDNRILPPQVDKEIADRDGWWYKPEYLFNELNINSAISSPGAAACSSLLSLACVLLACVVLGLTGAYAPTAHGEVLPLATPGPYVLKGWAYSGGGRKVTRVETSLDGGNTWYKSYTRLRTVQYGATRSALRAVQYYCARASRA
eukprot:3937577-Rhodomonas_salina.1